MSVAVAATALVCTAAVPPDAGASRGLTRTQRKDILRSFAYLGPNQTRIRDASCISGRLSTVDRRFASTYLSNTPSCVRRHGGASGEGSLVKRKNRRSRRWRVVGSVGDNCMRGQGGAPDRVLEDLGCYLYGSASARGTAALSLTDLPLTPDRIGPVKLGMTGEEIGSALGVAIDAEPSVNACTFFGLPAPLQYKAQLLATEGVLLDLILIYGRGVRTTKGIRVGDSLRKLRSAYGRRLAVAPRGNDLSAADHFYWVRSQAGTTNVLRFAIYRGKVSGMEAGTRDLVVGFGECS